MTGPTIEFNILAKDLANAVEAHEASAGRAYVGLLVKDHPDDASAIALARAYAEAGVRASIGLGAGDPNAWRRVAAVAAATAPAHVNQVLPATGYTMGLLGPDSRSIVNALIAPGSAPGRVRVGTGPVSTGTESEVPAEAAAALLADIGAPSVKFFPIKGLGRLENLRVMVRAAVAAGIPIVEPTGGIDLDNVREIVDACVAEGATHVIPHVYTSIIDAESGCTRPGDVETLARILS